MTILGKSGNSCTERSRSIPCFLDKKTGIIPILIILIQFLKVGIFPAFESKFFFLLLFLINYLSLRILLIFNIIINSISSDIFSEFFRSSLHEQRAEILNCLRLQGAKQLSTIPSANLPINIFLEYLLNIPARARRKKRRNVAPRSILHGQNAEIPSRSWFHTAKGGYIPPAFFALPRLGLSLFSN